MNRMSTPPRPQEMIAAGPAAIEAFSAPKSQPDPMIEPTLAKSRPTTPTWRLSFGFCEVSVVLMAGWPFFRQRHRHGSRWPEKPQLMRMLPVDQRFHTREPPRGRRDFGQGRSAAVRWAHRADPGRPEG